MNFGSLMFWSELLRRLLAKKSSSILKIFLGGGNFLPPHHTKIFLGSITTARCSYRKQDGLQGDEKLHCSIEVKGIT